MLDKVISTINAKTQVQTEKENINTQTKSKTKWATFTYVGQQTKFITKLFKNTNLKVAFKTDNTFEKLLTRNQIGNKNNSNRLKNGMYQLTCEDCIKYIGQRGRQFHIRFQEHFRDFKYGNGKSKFAQHLLDNRRTIGPMEEIMKILQITKKGKMMNTLERFYMYNETEIDNQINDIGTIKQNIIFDTVIEKGSGRGHPTQQLLVHGPDLI